MNFCSSLVSLIEAAVAGAKKAIRPWSLLLAMAEARCTPEVVWRSQSAPCPLGLDVLLDHGLDLAAQLAELEDGEHAARHKQGEDDADHDGQAFADRNIA